MGLASETQYKSKPKEQQGSGVSKGKMILWAEKGKQKIKANGQSNKHSTKAFGSRYNQAKPSEPELLG